MKAEETDAGHFSIFGWQERMGGVGVGVHAGKVGVKGPVVVCDKEGISSCRVFCAPLAVSEAMCHGC